MIHFTVLGLPIPKARARTMTLANGRPHTYTPDKTGAWENSVKIQARRHRPKEPLDGPLMAELTFYLPKPSTKPAKILYPDVKPDLDNLAKSIFDALEGEFFVNDSRFVDQILRKRYGEPARVEITIGPMGGGLSGGSPGEMVDHGYGDPAGCRRVRVDDPERPNVAMASAGCRRSARPRSGARGRRAQAE